MKLQQQVNSTTSLPQPLSWFTLDSLFSCIKLSGKDALKFLEAITTQTFKTLIPPSRSKQAVSALCSHPALPSAILDKNAKIRVLFYLYPTSIPNTFILLVVKAYHQVLLKILAEYHFTEAIDYKVLTTDEIFIRSPHYPAQNLNNNTLPPPPPTLHKEVIAPSTHLEMLTQAPYKELLTLNITNTPTAITTHTELLILRTPFTTTSINDNTSAPPTREVELLYITLKSEKTSSQKDQTKKQPSTTAALSPSTTAALSPSTTATLSDYLKKQHLSIYPMTDWHQNRLTRGNLLLGSEIRANDFILELPNAHEYIAIQKGCYPGQEIIARMMSHERQSTKKLVRLTFEAPDLPSFTPKDVLKNEDRILGEVRSTFFARNQPKTLSVIALLHKDYYTAGTTFPLLHEERIYNTTVNELAITSATEPTHTEQPRLKELATLHEKGLRAYHNDDYNLAETIFKDILQQKPSSADSLEALAVIAERKGNLDEAIKLNKKLKALTPTAIMPHTNLSRLYMLKGWIDKAEAEQQKSTLLSMKQISQQKTREREAENLKAKLEEKRKQKLQLFHQALTLDPKDTIALFSLGKLFYESKDYSQAASYLERLLKLTNEHSTAYLFYGKTLCSLGRHEEAAHIFKTGCKSAEQQGHFAPLKAMKYELSELKQT
ncbi:hypothetical protein COTS27_01347 [Spirochaetota bacterium]|nr:hypothetical protein COTS27_01347 [Spirochaetota bacterium]